MCSEVGAGDLPTPKGEKSGLHQKKSCVENLDKSDRCIAKYHLSVNTHICKSEKKYVPNRQSVTQSHDSEG